MANKNTIIAEWKSTESTYCYPVEISKKFFLNNKGKQIKKYDRKINRHTLFALQKQGK